MAQTGKSAFLPIVPLIKSTVKVGKFNPFKELFVVYRKVCPNAVSALFRQCSFVVVLTYAGKKGAKRNCSAQLGIVRNSTTQDDLNLEMRFFD